MLVLPTRLDRCKSREVNSRVVVFLFTQNIKTMFKKLFEWAKNLFASMRKHEPQSTAAETENESTLPTPRRVSSLAANDWERIEQAMEQALPLTCQVLTCKKGGYTVSVLGTYAFLPTSLAHYKKSHTPDKMLGKLLKVYVRNVQNSNITVSHIEFVRDAYSKLAVGDVHDAVVAKILDGRLLVYMPENELYATVSQPELSWSMNATTGDFYPGQHVSVRIIKTDGLEKIRASIRQAGEANPYEKCINDYHEGDVMTGTVINVVDFGAFVKITEGVAGLLHRSEVRWDEPAPNMKEIFKYGDIVKIMVCRIDHEQGRIFFSIKRLNINHIADTYKAGSVHKGRITYVTDKLVNLAFPYEVKAQTRIIRLVKAGITPTEGETIDVRVLSYSPENNEIKFALDS